VFLDLPPDTGAIRALSIKTVYADKIRDGTKLFELRTYCPNILPGGWCVLYESSPTQHIQTAFKAGRTFQLSPDETWQIYSDYLGIDFDSFFTYFRKRKFAYGVEINYVHSFDPVPLSELRSTHSFSPPQGCQYLKNSIYKRFQAELQLP
jgi:predicted transcriptional regulator